MPSYRKGRINEAIARELCVALREARDPVIAEAFVSVTRAEAAPDLKIAKIYFSHLAGEEKEVKKALVRAQGMLRRHLAETLNLRITPELLFAADKSGEHGARISALLKQIHDEDAARAEATEEKAADDIDESADEVESEDTP